MNQLKMELVYLTNFGNFQIIYNFFKETKEEWKEANTTKQWETIEKKTSDVGYVIVLMFAIHCHYICWLSILSIQ